MTGGQQGSPTPPEVIADIVNFEESLFTAQIIVPGVGRLDSDGARGGPEALSIVPKVAGRFDLFDAWANHVYLEKAVPVLISTNHHETADGNPLRIFISRASVRMTGSENWISAQ